MKSYPATTILLGLLIGFFVIEMNSGAVGVNAELLRLGAMPDTGGLQGQYWRVFTYSILHYDALHILLNGFLIWWTGRIVERRVGGLALVGLYLAAVISGGVLVAWWKSLHPTPSVTVGASAGAFGFLAASLVLIHRPVAAGFGQSRVVRVLLWSILVVGITISFLPGVSFMGHLAGLVCGVVLGFFLPVRAIEEK